MVAIGLLLANLAINSSCVEWLLLNNNKTMEMGCLDVKM